MTDLHPIVAALDHRTRRLDWTSVRVASHLTVTGKAVSHWRTGDSLPSIGDAAGWACAVGLTLAVVGEGRIWAQGAAIGSGFAQLRSDRGLSQAEFARRIPADASVVSRVERQPDVRLPTAMAYVAALGLRLTVLGPAVKQARRAA